MPSATKPDRYIPVRIVLDTNVVVSALIWGGQPLRLLELAADGIIILCTSPILLEELAEVLQRNHLAPRLAAKGNSVEQALKEYAELALKVMPQSVPEVVSSDPDDDHVIAAAAAAGAQAIVSGDSDLLRLKAHHDIKMWTVGEAIEKIERV
ncbi:MAG: putative toxin-antitoxin system toxin component, PIN family [Sphingorhabdus sp.]